MQSDEFPNKRKKLTASCSDQHVSIDVDVPVVLLGDRAIPEAVPYVAPIKPKKPKHTKRKLAQAALLEDSSSRAEALLKTEKEKEELAEFKKLASKNWKRTCKKLVKKSLGEDKWNEEKFLRLEKKNLSKEAFLSALGVPSNLHKEHVKE